MERSIFKIKNGKKPRVFTSNREILYPKLKEIAKKGERARGNLKKYMQLIDKLLEIAEDLEQIVSINGLRYKCVFTEEQEMRTKDSYVGKIVTMIYRYCEPLEEESMAYIYLNLERIEEWLNY